MELVNATVDDLSLQPPVPTLYKMIATVLLQNGFVTGFGLGRNFQGTIEPILVPVKGARYGLGYTLVDDYMKMKKSSDQALATPIPHLYQSFVVREYANLDDLGKESVAFSRRTIPSSRRRLSQLAFVMRNQGRYCKIGRLRRS